MLWITCVHFALNAIEVNEIRLNKCRTIALRATAKTAAPYACISLKILES